MLKGGVSQLPGLGITNSAGSFWEQEWQSPPGWQELQTGTDSWGLWVTNPALGRWEQQKGQCRDTQISPPSRVTQWGQTGLCGHLSGPSSLAGAALCALISILFHFFTNLLFTHNSCLDCKEHPVNGLSPKHFPGLLQSSVQAMSVQIILSLLARE